MANAGRVLTRDVLIDRIWGPNYFGDTKTLDVHIKRLRSKLESDSGAPDAHRDRARRRLPLRAGAATGLARYGRRLRAPGCGSRRSTLGRMSSPDRRRSAGGRRRLDGACDSATGSGGVGSGSGGGSAASARPRLERRVLREPVEHVFAATVARPAPSAVGVDRLARSPVGVGIGVGASSTSGGVRGLGRARVVGFSARRRACRRTAPSISSAQLRERGFVLARARGRAEVRRRERVDDLAVVVDHERGAVGAAELAR